MTPVTGGRAGGDQVPQKEGRLWGGRFAGSPERELMALSRSEAAAFDLAPYDIASSIAHSRQLLVAGVLDTKEQRAIEAALVQLSDEYLRGSLRPLAEDEDLFGFLERELVARVGPSGSKIRAGRSRNDQAANDLRLYLRDHARVVHDFVLDLVDALLAQADAHRRTIAPGFTHLQPAQPVVFGHHLLAHCQALLRDVGRLEDWDARTALCPLGAAALAGSPLVTEPERLASELGYDGVAPNSIDAVASRDTVCEFLFVAAIIGVDLSRLAEEVTLWVSDQFSWAELDDGFSTGSSIMPQKKNPDIAELTRGRAARMIGLLTTMLGALKGLPFAYNRDMSEDKHVAMDAVATLLLVLPAMSGLVRTLRFDVARMRRDAAARSTLATEVADWLTERGVPFHEAHIITGRLVQVCERERIGLESLDADALGAVDPRLEAAVTARLTLESAIERRDAVGGTSFRRVDEQLANVRARVAAQRSWSTNYRGPRPWR
ncbi:MAG TPA: argininosuccinate lyase [Acidimicrobiales bacterium]|nr:argininosuccinate lyase [Acidimicrobiales bacterium]